MRAEKGSQNNVKNNSSNGKVSIKENIQILQSKLVEISFACDANRPEKYINMLNLLHEAQNKLLNTKETN